MPQDNTAKQLIINKLSKEQYNELSSNSQLSNSELYVITDDNHYTEQEITTLLSTKQGLLTIGQGILIDENDIISLDLENVYLREEIDILLSSKSDLNVTGNSLEYDNNILTLKNVYGDVISSVTIKSLLQTDNITVSYNTEDKLQSIGEITKNGTPKYTWIGTQEEYDKDLESGIIDEYTECLITDTEAEGITPIVQFEAPTKLSELANDMDFTTNAVVQEIKSELENKIDTKIDDTNLVHKTGTEVINGFKTFTEEITIQNGGTKGRISHKNTTSETPSITDGYIEFGENTLKYGKESEQGLLYHTENDIFHSGNLIAGNNIAITHSNGVYKINGQAGGGTGGTTVYVDEETIVKNDQEVITTVGVKSKNDTVLYDWVGTLEEYQTGVTDGTIQSNWICWITDDENKNGITPVYGSDIALLDIVITNQALEGVDKIGKELQGSLVLKSEYPDAYKKLLNQKNKATSVTETINGIEVTYYQCTNGWKVMSVDNKSVYDELFENTGSANFFVLDETSENFYLPKTNNLLQPNVNVGELGRYNEAGLPNITGNIVGANISGDGVLFVPNNDDGYRYSPNGSQNHTGVNFNASRSNSIYGNSDTVQPQSTNVFIYYKVGNTLQESATIDMEAQILELQNKLTFNMFDTKTSDHILEGEEAIGWALQGSYVYKNSLVERVGYTDFYNRCVEEFNDRNNLEKCVRLNIVRKGDLKIDNGVLNNFSTTNYAMVPNNVSFGNSFEMVIKHRTGTDVTTGSYLTAGLTGTYLGLCILNGLIYFSVGNGSSWTDISGLTGTTTIQPNTTYYTKVTYDGTKYQVLLSMDNLNWNLEISANSTQIIPEHTRLIGINRNLTQNNLGSIDLKECYIDINGERFWTGADKVTENLNGHMFYHIKDKSVVDDIYNQYGIAWFYGIDEENERIWLPRNNWFEQLTGDVNEVNKMVEAGLPDVWFYGATKQQGFGYVSGQSHTSESRVTASSQNSIYGNSDTVQPPASKKLLYICVGNTSKVKSLSNITDITTTENDTIPLLYSTYQSHKISSAGWLKADNKSQPSTLYPSAYNYLEGLLQSNPNNIPVINTADIVEGEDYTKHFKVDLTNQTFTLPIRTSERILVAKKEVTNEDNTWYNLYSDGWCEQGGQAYSTDGTVGVNITLVRAYNNTNYSCITSSKGNAYGTYGYTASIISNNTISIYWNYSNGGRTAIWQTSGYTQIPTLEEYTEPLYLYFKVGNALQHLEVIDMLHQADLNNPYFLGMSEYFENRPNNLSWLKSEGQWNSKDVYVSYYEWLEEQYNEGNENVKLYTEEYDDYNFVLNQEEGTFRLPLLNGSENLTSDKTEAFELQTSGAEYEAPANGWFNLCKTATAVDQYIMMFSGTMRHLHSAASTKTNVTVSMEVKKGQKFQVYYTVAGTTNYFNFIYAQGNGDLYYYVGETVQNANLINAGRIEETKANKTDVDGQWVVKNEDIILNVSLNGSTPLEIDLSDYLPNDGYDYECNISSNLASTTTSGQECIVMISSDTQANVTLCRCRSVGTATKSNICLSI